MGRDESAESDPRFERLETEVAALKRAFRSSDGTDDGDELRNPDAVSLDDIAHALANQTRFAGHADEPYSVARHAVHVSREVDARGGSAAAVRWGLLHDATEAYLADVPAPVEPPICRGVSRDRRTFASLRRPRAAGPPT